MHPLVVFSIVIKKYSQPKSLELCFIQLEYLGLQAWEAVSQVNPERTTLRR